MAVKDQQSAFDVGVRFADPEWFDSPDVYFIEPRVLWGVRQQAGGTTTRWGPGRFVFENGEFKNRSRHEFVMTHVLMDGIGYVLDRVDPGTPPGLNSFIYRQDRLSPVQYVQMRVNAPYRKQFSRAPLPLISRRPLPNAGPDQSFGAVPDASSVHGINRWDFPRPYKMPPSAAMQFDLSTFAQPDPGTLPTFTIGFKEWWPDGNRFRGQSRTQEGQLLGAFSAGLPVPPEPFPGSEIAFPLDGYPYNGGIGTATRMWPGTGFDLSGWRQQEGNRGRKVTYLQGFQVAINQSALDQEYIDLGFGPVLPSRKFAPLASRVGTRARTRSGGSSEWWWRPGAPLSLVCPTITPAQVFEFDKPLILAPGERLDVELEFPEPVTVDPDEAPLDPNYTVGVSVCGYALIRS